MTKVFVYGTLLRGERNHPVIARGELVGPARTTARFTLYDLGSYAGIVDGGRTAIVGELYLVDDDTLKALDRLEGHPDLYRRTLIELEGGEQAEAYVYRATHPRRLHAIACGSWIDRPRKR